MREIYQFICDQRKHFPVGELCKAVGVSRSCYYEYRNGITYANRSSDQQLAKEVNELFCFHRRRYGSRRITKALQYKGVCIGRFKVRRLLRDQSLKAIQPKSFVPKTTNSNHQLGYAPNVVAALDFPSQPDEVYVGDITYLPASNGQWFYLNVWIDLFSRRVVGWKVDTQMEENLVVDSLRQALCKRNPAAGLIVHSDRGGQYAATRFKEVLKNYRCIQSMSGADNPYDNAYAESFFSRFKAELLEKGVFESIQDATTEIFNYIEMYYNTQRLHSSLNYLSPLQYEERFYESEKEALTVC
jgi:putative transposase